jgi:hypothetical protein
VRSHPHRSRTIQIVLIKYRMLTRYSPSFAGWPV